MRQDRRCRAHALIPWPAPLASVQPSRFTSRSSACRSFILTDDSGSASAKSFPPINSMSPSAPGRTRRSPSRIRWRRTAGESPASSDATRFRQVETSAGASSTTMMSNARGCEGKAWEHQSCRTIATWWREACFWCMGATELARTPPGAMPQRRMDHARSASRRPGVFACALST